MAGGGTKRWLWLVAPLAVAAVAVAVWPAADPVPVVARQPEAPAVALPGVDDGFGRRPRPALDSGEPPTPSLPDAGSAPPNAGTPDASVASDAGMPAADGGPFADAGTLAGLSTLDAGAPPVAGRPEPQPGTDPRFGLRWSLPGHCGPGFERQQAARAALLATFPVTTLQGARFFHDPDVDPMRVVAAGDALGRGRSIATGLLGPDAAVGPPDIYLYATTEALRNTSCVNQATAGYYDGAIHVAADDPDLERTVIHENVHHVLNSLGVSKPMWLHEGLAMFAAEETWWRDERLGLVKWLRTQHLPFEGLALAFPHSSDELFAAAVYYQSFRMVEFILVLSPDRGGIYRLVAGLRTGTIQPQTAFGQSTGSSGDALEQAWKQFVTSR